MAWLTLQRAGVYASLSTKTLRRAMDDPSNQLPARRVRGRWLIKESDLDQWIESHEDRPGDDIVNIVDDVLANFGRKKEARGQAGPDQHSNDGRVPK